MKTICTADRTSYRRMTTAELREHFLIETLFHPGRAELYYTDVDRAVVGSIVPLVSPIGLEAGKEMACAFFCERREVGVINLGNPGSIVVDGVKHSMAPRDCLYIGRGSKEIQFSSDHPEKTALFYLVSYPAHTSHPTTHASAEQANKIELGSAKESNRRTIRQYIRPGGIASCQLVMGYTELLEGSVWNTFPPHTHDRRTEVYCYFDLPTDGVVMHFLGEPGETRHLVMREKQVALSPPWSVHSGAGAGSYRFVWAMGGENQVFDDMDKCDMSRLA